MSDVNPIPITPSTVSKITIKPQVKSATPDIVLFNDDTVPIEVMSDLIFEDIGGQELLSISRSDTINGQEISYQPIKNLTAIQQQYNPNNILGLQTTSDKYFSNFSIKFDARIPSTGPNVYIEDVTGDLIIDVANMADDEQVEVEITVSGTIYEVTI